MEKKSPHLFHDFSLSLSLVSLLSSSVNRVMIVVFSFFLSFVFLFSFFSHLERSTRFKRAVASKNCSRLQSNGSSFFNFETAHASTPLALLPRRPPSNGTEVELELELEAASFSELASSSRGESLDKHTKERRKSTRGRDEEI